MVVVRFKLQCQPDRTEEVVAAMRDVIAPSRKLAGVVHFDIGRDLTDANSLIATEVYENRSAMEKQETLAEVGQVIKLIEAGAAAGPPEWTIYDGATAESPEL